MTKCKKLSEITQPMIAITVQDDMSKKVYFQDSEVVGWVIISKDVGIELYHLYQRGFNEDEAIDEWNILPDEPLCCKKEFSAMLDEVETQHATGESKTLRSEVRAFIHKHDQNQ